MREIEIIQPSGRTVPASREGPTGADAVESIEKAPSRKIEDLQLLRGVAIALVLFNHLSLSAAILNGISKSLSVPFYWGVELFFVLSGYVVTKSLRSKSFDAGYFLMKRAFRLYPAILVLLIVGAVINAAFRHSGYSEFIKNLFSVDTGAYEAQATAVLFGYLINRNWDHVCYQIAQMWSLSVEFQFYAASAAWICIVPRRFRSVAYVWIAAATTVVGVLYRFEVGFDVLGFRNPFLAYVIDYKFDFMACGVLLASVPSTQLKAILQSLTRWRAVPYVALLTVTMCLMVVASPLSPLTGMRDSNNGPGMLVTLAGSTFLVAYGAVGGIAESNAVPGVLRRWLIALGDVSFTVYLLHFCAMTVAWVLINEYWPSAFASPYRYGLAQAALALLILFPATSFVYQRVEVVGIQIGDRIIRRLALGARAG